MSIFDQVQDLFESSNPSIAERAEFVKEYSEKLNQGEILIDEYDELMGDILNLAAIEAKSDDLDEKMEMKKAFDRLMEVVKIVKSVV